MKKEKRIALFGASLTMCLIASFFCSHSEAQDEHGEVVLNSSWLKESVGKRVTVEGHWFYFAGYGPGIDMADPARSAIFIRPSRHNDIHSRRPAQRYKTISQLVSTGGYKFDDYVMASGLLRHDQHGYFFPLDTLDIEPPITLQLQVGKEISVEGYWHGLAKGGPYILMRDKPYAVIELGVVGCEAGGRVTQTRTGIMNMDTSSGFREASPYEAASAIAKINKLHATYRENEVVRVTGTLCYYENRFLPQHREHDSYQIQLDHYFFDVNEAQITSAEAHP